MSIIQSKLTAQGQTSVPAEVRRKLGLGPGSVLEWEDRDGEFVIRRAKRYTSEEVHKVLFPEGPPKIGPVNKNEAIGEYMRKKHARS